MDHLNQGINVRSLFNIRSIPRFIEPISKIDFGDTSNYTDTRLSVDGKKQRDAVDVNDEYSYLYDFTPDDYRNIPFFSRDYSERKKDLFAFASYPEIEFIVHSIAYDAIVYDEKNFFLNLKLDSSLKDTYVSKITNSFKTIYHLLGFSNGRTAWEKFVEFIIGGDKAYEIIYDNPYKPKEIIGFVDIDPGTLIPFISEISILKSGVTHTRKVRMWKQIVEKNGTKSERILPDNSIIYIQYSKIGGANVRQSYVERLVRNFNLKRNMENCKAAWQIMNSQHRLKIVLPVGTRNSDKAKQALASANNRYKEEISIDSMSGEVFVNGSPLISFGKTIVLPSRSGATPDIGSMAIEGPNMSDLDIVKHFERALWRDSILPFSRFDKDNGGGTTIVFSEDGITNDDRFYYNFFSSVRSVFCEIIKKPLLLQTYMDFPSFTNDGIFKSKIGFTFNSDSQYEQAKNEQIETHKLDRINKWLEFKTDNGEPVFNMKYLFVDKYNLLTSEEWINITENKNANQVSTKTTDEEPGIEDTGTRTGDTTTNTTQDEPVDEPGTDQFTPPQ